MNQLKIYTIKNPNEEALLRLKSEDVTLKQLSTEEFQRFLDELLYTAKTSEEQVGLESGGISAPQVGVSQNVIYIFDYDTLSFELFLNPQIQNVGEKTNIDTEGCLSVPDIEKKVERYNKIKVNYLDKEGKKQKRRLSGLNARAIQHEVDHLNGILFIDKAIE